MSVKESSGHPEHPLRLPKTCETVLAPDVGNPVSRTK